MSNERRPAAFPVARPDEGESARQQPQREPRAIEPAEVAVITPPELDPFEAETASPPAVVLPRSRFGWSKFLGLSLGLLLSLAFGLWLESLIRSLFARADWLGWIGLGLSVAVIVALAVIILRELLALMRLGSVARLQARAAVAAAGGSAREARDLVGDVAALVAHRSETALARRSLEKMKGEVVDAPDLIRYAEAELMGPLDEAARRLILSAGRRVSVVTAVSPRALIDVAYVLFESARLIRRLADLYGGRPGMLGFVRLVHGVTAHLAVTGTMAVGDSFVHEIVGHGLAARLSARLGEGVVNGMMTVRIGIAAMETVRPLPFDALRRPRMSDFVSALASVTRSPAVKGDSERPANR
jgi:putative membrane protein